jgi:hypothetical protein
MVCAGTWGSRLVVWISRAKGWSKAMIFMGFYRIYMGIEWDLMRFSGI